MPDRARLAATATAVLLAHALLVALAWHGLGAARPAPRPPAQRVVMQLLPASTHTARLPAASPVPTPLRQPRPSSQAPRAAGTPVAAATAPQATPNPPPSAAPSAVPPADAPISGAVFALPRIGFGTPSPNGWMNPPQASGPLPGHAMPMPSQLAALASARSAEEAGRSQLMQALRLELSAIAVPQDIEQGHCTLDAHAPALSCDPEPLHGALGARQAVLAAMLDAYRRLMPAEPVIALQSGHLHLVDGLRETARP